MVLNTIGKVHIVNKYYQYYCLDFLSSRPVSLCAIDHFTVACLVAWPSNESEAGGDIVLIETFLLFLC